MGDHESDGLEYQDDEEEEDEDDEPVHDLTGGGALLSVQPPAATAAPRLYPQTSKTRDAGGEELRSSGRSEVGNHKRRSLNTWLSSGTSAGTFACPAGPYRKC